MNMQEVKAKHNVQTDSLAWLMLSQEFFESQRIGTDGTLYDHNTLEHGITRGIIGEAQEALEELRELKIAEVLTPDDEELLTQIRERLQMEIIDVQIFIASVMIHAGLTAPEVVEKVVIKMRRNNEKYRTENFEGRTVADGLEYSRELAQRSGLLGEPLERGSDTNRTEPEEHDSVTGFAGSLA